MSDRFRKGYVELNDTQINAVDSVKRLAETMEQTVKDALPDCPERPKGERERLLAIGTTDLEKVVAMYEKALT